MLLCCTPAMFVFVHQLITARHHRIQKKIHNYNSKDIRNGHFANAKVVADSQQVPGYVLTRVVISRVILLTGDARSRVHYRHKGY
jgi:hypothetical protein